MKQYRMFKMQMLKAPNTPADETLFWLFAIWVLNLFRIWISNYEFKILKGWHQIRNGHSLASQGRWSEAREQLKMGEGVIGNMNDRQPSNLIHMMIDGVDAYED